MLGINNEAHLRASSTEKWHELGHALAPKDLWREFFQSPGLQDLTIRQTPRRDEAKGYTDVSLQPSTMLHPGVYVRINEHFAFTDSDNIGADHATTALKKHWPASVVFSESVFARIEKSL